MKCRIVDYSKPSISHIKVKNNIKKIVSENNYSEDVSNIVLSLYNYMTEKKFFGGCHVFSSILYVAFSEIGLETKIFVGECQKKGERAFDHSWVTVDDKIVDLAIYYPLTEKINSMGGPIVLDVEATTLKMGEIAYGINTGLPLSSDTNIVINAKFDTYMSKFPHEINGLWTILKKIMPSGYDFNLDLLKEKYADTKRVFVR